MNKPKKHRAMKDYDRVKQKQKKNEDNTEGNSQKKMGYLERYHQPLSQNMRPYYFGGY